HQGEALGHREHHEHGALLEEVDQVHRGQEERVEDREDDRDHDHRSDHGEDAALPSGDAAEPQPEVLPQRLGDDLGRQLGLDRLFRGDRRVGRQLYRVGHQRCAPVVMYSTTLWRSKFLMLSWTTSRPRYITAILSATSNTSFRLCEITITASP